MGERYRGWSAIGYPESMPDNWLQFLDDLHVPIAAIIHDRDAWIEGESSDHVPGEGKKEHVHINFYFDNVKSKKQVLRMLEPLGIFLVEPIHNTQSATRYLLHLDHPKKAQYLEDEMLLFGGFIPDFERTIPQSRVNEIMHEMCKFIRENDVTEFFEFWCYCEENNNEWFNLLNNSKSYVINKALTSKRHGLMRE